MFRIITKTNTYYLLIHPNRVGICKGNFIIVLVVKSRRMRWAGYVARMWERRVVNRVLVGKPEGKRPMGRPKRRWRIILKCIFRKWEGVVRTG
jgi:hypothetical protein